MLTRKMIVGMIMAVLVWISATSWATTYYVAPPPDGNDDANGLSWETAFATIQKGVNEADTGDTVMVADGVYTGDGNRDINPGTKDITIQSENGPYNCIINCQGKSGENHIGFNIENYSNNSSTLDGFTIENGYTNEYHGGGAIYCGYSSNPTINNCIIRNNKIAGYKGGGISSLLSNATIQNCLLIGNNARYGGAIAHWGLASGCIKIINCTITKNSTSYGAVYCEASVKIENSIILGNGGDWSTQVYVKNNGSVGTVVDIAYCDIQNGQDGVYVDSGTLNWGDGNIDADPCFAFSNDYHLMADSPCIDAGTNSPSGGLPATDMEGNSRQLDGDGDQTATADMGVYEYDDVNSCIAVPARIDFYVPYLGIEPNDKSLSILNSGGGTLDWSISEDANWLDVSPQSGESTGDINEVLLSVVDVSGLSSGTYYCMLAVTDSNAINSPRYVLVTLNVGQQGPDDGSIIDIMINYPRDDTASPEDIENMWSSAEGVVNFYNEIFENSQINPRLRLVYAGPVYPKGNYTEVMDPDDGVMDEVHLLREIFAADIVGVDTSQGTAWGDFFFAVGVNWVSAHEMGHTLTLPDNTTSHIFTCEDYGHLHKTIMNQYGYQILYFSNPDVSYHGTATGTTLLNSAGRVNLNAYLIANRRLAAIKRIIYVDKDANGFNDGSCWEDAFNDLQDALAEYDGKYGHLDEIWIAEGTYKPGTGRTDAFQLVQGVTIYGGFDGTENALDERDPTQNETILSGDIGTVGVASDNCYHVVTGPDDGFRVLNGLAVLDGVTITGGNANGSTDEQKRGAGIYVLSGSPAIKNCIIKDNASQNEGGGIYTSDSDTKLTSCILFDNSANNGGAIYSADGNSVISNCTITENSASAKGGGLCCNDDVNETVINCIFWDNTASASGGPEIAILSTSAPAIVSVEYSDVKGGSNDVYIEDGDCTLNWGDGIINSDPNFSAPASNDFHLEPASPCINAGDPNIEDTSELDIDLDTRLYAGIVDMGADEILHLAYNVMQDNFYLNIQDAINDANNDDIIEVYDGIFYEAVDFNGMSITLCTADPNDWEVVAETVIDGNDASQAVKFVNSEDANSVLEGFTVTNAEVGVYCSGSNPTIKNCIIKENQKRGIHCQTSSSPVITNNKIGENGWDGILCEPGSNPEIKNNWIYKNDNGIYCTNPLIKNNTIVYNTNYGIKKGIGTPDPNSVISCIIWGNGNDLHDAFSAIYSCIGDCNAANGVGNICGDGNEPSFVNADANDFHLNPDSPCINAGDPNSDCDNETDIDGESRVKAKRIDMGADESGTVHNIDKDLWYLTIQSAVDDANNGNEIEIYEGLYTGQGNRDIDFGGKAITVRSTDPNDWGVVEATIIDCQGTVSAPHRGFYFHNGEDNNSVISGLTITNGYGNSQGGLYAGGAVFCTGSSPTISKCLMVDNVNDSSITNVDGGGIACYAGANPRIINCIIRDNTAYWAGGISCWDSSPTIVGCIINNNTAEDCGGGISCWDSNATVSNCTIEKNSAGKGGGLYNYEALPEVTNCIFWDNNSAVSGDEIYNDVDSDPNFSYCDIEGCGGSSGWDPNFGNNGGGNIDSDPCFVNADANNFHLELDSPCINAGDPNGDYDGQVDIDNELRVMAERVDIGIDEVSGVFNLDQQKGYDSIQAAIDDANTNENETIEVSPGTYYETVDFNGVSCTLRSVDPNDWAIVAATIIDANSDSNNPGRVVTFDDGEDANSILTGFTITGGYVSGTGDGGGIYCEGSSPTISRCVIQYNYAADDGGGIFCYDSSSPSISDCRITNNDAGDGGGICCDNGSSPTISDCEITDNEVEDKGGAIYCKTNSSPTIKDCDISLNEANFGGGVYCRASDPQIEDCNVSGNYAADDAGGIYCYDGSSPTISDCQITNNEAGDKGGGIRCKTNSCPTIKDCEISSNNAYKGGGIYCSSDPKIERCIISDNQTFADGLDENYADGGGIYCSSSNPNILNCIISGNISDDDAGGIYCYNGSDPNIINCTLTGNQADDKGGGIYCKDGSDAVITNCILWGNTAVIGPQIHTATSTPVVSYSDVQGTPVYPGTGNINTNPAFADAYHLLSSSPCIDVGDSSGDYDGQVDIDGDERVIDIAGKGDGNVDVDMGADEFKPD